MNKILTIVLLTFTSIAFAQNDVYFDPFKPVRRHAIGLNLGTNLFHGDADDHKLGLQIGGFYKYSFSPTISGKLNADFGVLRGGREKMNTSQNLFYKKNVFDPGNQWSPGDGYNFRNIFVDADATVNFILGNLSFVRKPRPWHLTGFFGVGFINSNAKGTGDDQFNKDYFQGADTTLVYKGLNGYMPFGFGVFRKLSENLDFGAEIKYFYTRGDNLDAFSFPVWRNRYMDSYTKLTFSLTYKLGKNKEAQHMDWVNPVAPITETITKAEAIVADASIDTDGDGVIDKMDKEPNTIKGAIVSGNGIALDTDGDGIIDAQDDEPFSIKGCKVDSKGVMLDGDNDGVADCKDEEPNTGKGLTVDRFGKTVSIGTGGSSCCNCNDVVLPSVFVDENGNIMPESHSSLYIIGNKLMQCPDLKLKLVSYQAMSKSGQQFASRKANTMIDYLNSNYGISRDRLSVDYKSSTGDSYSRNKIDIKKN